MLPEFADGGALPAASGFGATFERGHVLGEVLPHVGGHRGTGAMEIEPTGQFVGQQGEIQRLVVRQNGGQKAGGGLGPGRLVGPAGRLGRKSGFVLQPLVTQAAELGGAEVQALGGGARIELAGVEGGQDFLDVEGRDAMRELRLFILGQSVAAEAAAAKRSEVFRFETRVEQEASSQQKSPSTPGECLGRLRFSTLGPSRRSGCASAEPYPALDCNSQTQRTARRPAPRTPRARTFILIQQLFSF